MYEKKGRCFSPSAQKRSFVHSKADCTQIAETKYITRYVQIYISCSITILQEFLQNFCRKVYCKQLSSFRLGFVKLLASSNFSFVILQLRHPMYTKQQNKKGANFKGEGKSNKHKFLTGLRWHRASSPAIFRPPLTQIWVMNLFPILLAKLGISIKSEADKLKFGLFTIFPCVQPAFKKAAAVPREATRAQKSACPPITSSRASASPSIYSNVLGRFSAEGVNFAELAPTE